VACLSVVLGLEKKGFDVVIQITEQETVWCFPNGSSNIRKQSCTRKKRDLYSYSHHYLLVHARRKGTVR